jgi:hypothetical protein
LFASCFDRFSFAKKTVNQSSVTEEELTLDLTHQDDLPFWEDFFERQKGRTKPPNPYLESLNQLIETLTSEEYLGKLFPISWIDSCFVDSKFMKTFITTYQSFMTPVQLLDKLMQRFNVPSDKIPKEKVSQIQLRVGIVLKYWLENQGQDFTAGLIAKLEQFIENQLRHVHADLAKLLQKELKNKIADRNFHLKEFRKRLPIPFSPPNLGHRTFFQYFMSMSDSEIARQMTLVDTSVFMGIQSKELLNQAWNKSSSKVKAPNVLNLLSRANRVSFWVASMILSVETVSERVKVLTKLVSIADELRKLNNFHTLMGVVAGLNQGSILRLKKTFEELPAAVHELSSSLEKLMSPESSYKNYRLALSKSIIPVLPYM